MDVASTMGTLAGSLMKIGAPAISGAIGGPAGAVAGVVIKSIADALGTAPTPEAVQERIETDPDAAETVRKLDADRQTEWLALQRASADLYAEMVRSEAGKGAFWSAWRPAGMWAILALWIWALVPAPLLGLKLDMGSLAAFTTLYLTLYMGGHTAKEWFSAHYGASRK